MESSITIEQIKIPGIKSGIRKYTDDIINYLHVVKLYREDLKFLYEIESSNHAGIYVLAGVDNEGRSVVYTGESENVCRRIVEEHAKNKEKDFFNEIFVVTTEDNTLNKAEIIFLEDCLYNRFKLSPNVKIVNSKTTSTGNLNNKQMNKMKIFTEIIVDILSAATNCNFLDLRYDTPEDGVFTLRGVKSVGITATYVKGKLIVHKDSLVAATVANSAPKYITNKREELIDMGVLIPYKNMMLMAQDYEFENINRATNILCGSSVADSFKKWLNHEGKSLEEYINN